MAIRSTATGAAANPLAWPSVIPAIDDGADAFAFVETAAASFPGLTEGVGAPLLDPLLRVPGFIEHWARSGNIELRRQLAFRLAYLGLADDAAVDGETATRVAVDVTGADVGILAERYAAAALRVFGGRWRPALARAVLSAPAPLPAALVRPALGESADEAAALALASDDVSAALEGRPAADLLTPLVHRACALVKPGSWRARAQTFVFSSINGARPPTELLRGCFDSADEYPENRSALVVQALGLLADGERAELLLAEPRLPWRYAGCSLDLRVVAAAAAALDSMEPDALDDPWIARAFHDWGVPGRRALAEVPSSTARLVESLLNDLAAHVTPTVDLSRIALPLRELVAAALSALQTDPAAHPSRTILDRLVDYPVTTSNAELVDQSRAWSAELVAAYMRLPKSALTALLRRFDSAIALPTPEPVPDGSFARVLVALARVVVPVWLAAHPEGVDAEQVISAAEAIIERREGEAEDACERLEAQVASADPGEGAALAALLISGAYRYATTATPLESQDSPPTVALAALTAGDGDVVAKVRRARRFWESFFLEILPAAHAATS